MQQKHSELQQQHGENHPDVADSYYNIGKVYDSFENNEKALEFYRKALNISLQVLEKNYPDEVQICNDIDISNNNRKKKSWGV